MNHFTKEYVNEINDFLHTYLTSTWNYRIEVFEIKDLLTAVLVTYDDQVEDSFEISTSLSYDEFLHRMSLVKPDWIQIEKEVFEGLAAKPHKTMGGCEGRTIYFIKGGSNPEYWTPESAIEDARNLLLSSSQLQGPMLLEEVQRIDTLIPRGNEHFRSYEHFVRVCINFLFSGELREAKAQARTEPGNEGTEIRDLIAQNIASEGFFIVLKTKYSSSEILFDAKNKDEISREDLRQVYCYLKPAIGLWGFIVCRTNQPDKVHSYNRTLFQNFIQTRGVLIFTDYDIEKMLKMKIRGRNPSEHLHKLMSDFLRSI